MGNFAMGLAFLEITRDTYSIHEAAMASGYDSATDFAWTLHEQVGPLKYRRYALRGPSGSFLATTGRVFHQRMGTRRTFS